MMAETRTGTDDSTKSPATKESLERALAILAEAVEVVERICRQKERRSRNTPAHE